ncbi:hypothetical protein LWI29_022302 [Acer saccharum]|uniref:Retrovirus-related Pol polyprotein from transposon TNT 1-94 n=1 Tax=Acer saccharum TaxID=4024 RepID=A0AA39SRZ9_ACESA|nr:hypothetical protein LWI29_022302 [Acer saccharum]
MGGREVRGQQMEHELDVPSFVVDQGEKVIGEREVKGQQMAHKLDTPSFGMDKGKKIMGGREVRGFDIALNSKPKDISDEDWNYVNRQACGTIWLCLAKDQKYFVMKETMALSLWKKLEDKYMTKSIENRLYLKKKLFRFQYKKGISMIEHLDNYNKILADLQNLDVEISDENKALLLLNSLPDTYEHLTTTLLYRKDEVKFIDVSNALVNNEYR